MSNNDALRIEDKIVHAIDGRRFAQIPNNLKCLIEALYVAVNDDEVVYCEKTEDWIKPDIILEIDGVKKYVSIKTGRAENVHNENFPYFIDYLRNEGISEPTIETIALFHYGDGTLDGTGKVRKPYFDIMLELKDRIEDANKELNYRKEFVLSIMYHCLFRGKDLTNPSIDAVYFGNEKFGIVATKKQIITYITKRSFGFFNNLHIGPLLLRPHSRYVNRSVEDERNRNRIVIYWPNLNADLEYISKRYDY